MNKMPTSPLTPKKRYSSISEYATPGQDDSNSSIYYSFSIADEDGNTVNKENSINGHLWNNQSPAVSRKIKANTPMLKKVLLKEFTPRNENNKRISINQSTILSPMFNMNHQDKKSKTQQSNVSFDLSSIKEQLPTGNDILNDSESDANDDLDQTIVENHIQTNKPNEMVKLSPVVEVRTPPIVQSPILTVQNQNNKKQDAADILRQANERKSILHTRNLVKANRERLNTENRKSFLPVVKMSHATASRRRSSIYTPCNVDPRTSINVLKNVAEKVSKSLAVNVPLPSIRTTKPILPKTSNGLKIKMAKTAAINAKDSNAAIERMAKTRMTMQPKLTISSTRQTMTANVRAKRRETKHFLTSMAVATSAASRSTSASTSDTNNSSTTKARSNITAFAKPSSIKERKLSIAGSQCNSNSTICQYCDKCFVKSHGMFMHLIEKCEKIPAAVRRAMLLKEHKENDGHNFSKT